MRLRKILFISLLIIAFSGNLFSSDKGYNIKVKIKGIKDTICFLGNYYGDKQYIKDTSKINSKGECIFSGKEDLDKGIYLIVTADKKYFEILINNEQNFSIETDSSNFVENMKIKGSPENTLFYDYLRFINKKQKEVEVIKKQSKLVKSNKDSTKLLQEKLTKIDKEVMDYKSTLMKNNPNSFVTKIFTASKEVEIPEAPLLPNGKKDSTFGYRYYKKHYFDNIDLNDDRLLRTPIFHGKLDEYLNKIVMPAADSLIKECDIIIEKARNNKEMFKYLVWYLTRTYELSNIMGYDAIFVHLAKKYYLSNDAYWVTKSTVESMTKRIKALEPILIGKKAPELIMLDTANTLQYLSKVKGKFTVILFWDPECGHCQKEVPKLKTFYDEKKKTYDFEIFAVCSDTNMAKMKKYIREHKLNWINVNGPRTVTENFHNLYDIISTPVIFILNENKIIIAKKLGEEQIEGFFKNYLKIKK